MKKMIGFLCVCLGLAFAVSSMGDDKKPTTLKDRISPVGKTCMAGDPCAAAAVVPAGGAARSGKEVFGAVCTNCHTAGVLGAPKFGSAAEWGPRAAKGLDTLNTHALNGFNSMPAKGTCAACSDDEVKAAVKYMVDGSK